MSMKTPKTRSEYESHLNILAEDKNGTVSNLPDIRIIDSLLSVKSLPNKRYNFITIDEQVRLMANSLATFALMKDFNKITTLTTKDKYDEQ